jgi:hypothetical protein
MTCRICRQQGETRILPIYAFGSEGLHACLDCQCAISDFVRAMATAATRSHLLGYKAAKHVAETREAV